MSHADQPTSTASIPKQFGFWINVAICSCGAIFGFGLLWLQEVTQLADTAGHAPVAATIVSMRKVPRGKQTVTLATVDYKPRVSDVSGCRVDVDLSPNTDLRPGQTLMLLPRKVGCYEPVIVGEIGNPRLMLCGVGLGLLGLATAIFQVRRWGRMIDR